MEVTNIATIMGVDIFSIAFLGSLGSVLTPLSTLLPHFLFVVKFSEYVEFAPSEVIRFEFSFHVNA